MNKILLVTLSASVATTLLATPTVSNVTMEQHASRTVKVTYTLSESSVVTLDVQTNAHDDVWVSIGGKNITRVWGDGNRLVTGAGTHTLYWAPEKSWNSQNKCDVKAVVKAWATDAPPDYMVADLTTSKTVRYYESAEQVPGGVTNDLYKTDRLLMRKIPAKGVEWRMGSPSGEIGKVTGGDGQETTHYVTLTNDYYLGVYELTQKQACKWLGVGTDKGESKWMLPVGGDNAAGLVSLAVLRGTEKRWPSDGHAVAGGCGLATLRSLTGVDFDLPTEAQWEFACRAGVSAALYTGKELSSTDGTNTVLDDIAWYDKNAGETKKVGLLNPNGFGLYDMLGNEAEFCLDRMQEDLGSASVIEPIGPETGSYIVVRGGAAVKAAYYSRSARRQKWVAIDNQYGECGFRLWAPAEAK